MQSNEPMTPKERWLAAIQMKPLDRLPFWPKLDAAYPRVQVAPFRAMSLDALHDWIGSDQHIWIAACFKAVHKRTAEETTIQNNLRRTVYRTPDGEMELVSRFDEASQSWHPREFPVRSREDIRRMTAFYEDMDVELDREALQRTREQVAQIGQEALTATAIGESPLMYWVEWLAGVEMAHYLLADYPDEVETLFAAMHQVLLKKTEILAEHSPVDVLYMTENTSTTLISPQQYRLYCKRHIADYGQIAHKYGRPLVLHMCGHLKALLPDLATLPVEAFEAFTSPTLGNTTLLDGRGGCPDKCLIGGTNVMLWLRPAGEIIAQIERDLAALPHHRGIAVTSAGVMTPFCQPETIREVCEWVKGYAVRLGSSDKTSSAA